MPVLTKCPDAAPHGRHEWIDGVIRRDCPGTTAMLTPFTLVALPNAYRGQAVADADTLLLRASLDLAKRQGSATAAADIAYELGRRASEDES